MKTTATYLDALRDRYHVGSDRALAKLLNVSHVSILRFRRCQDSFSPRTAARVAELLDLDAAEVAVHSLAQRSPRDDERALWLSLAARLERKCH